MDKEYKISVAKNVERLAKVASKIEAAHPKISSELDSLNENYFSIMKEAQYVGIQGYALRNKRCFDNCLRQKRASSDKPYDVLWSECHEEYLNSINDNDYEKWNKYASVQDKKLPDFQRELIKTADTLLELSDKVEDPKDAEELIAVANEMIREAQLGQWLGKQVGNLVGKLTPSIRNIRRNLEQLQQQLSAAAGKAGNPALAENIKAGVLRGLQRYVKDFTTNPDYRSIVHPRAKAAINQIAQSLGQMQAQVSSADAANLASVLQQAAQTTDQLVQFAHKGIEIPAGEDKDKDGSPDIVDPDGGTKPSPAAGGGAAGEAASGAAAESAETPVEKAAEQTLDQAFGSLRRTIDTLISSLGENKERGIDEITETAKAHGFGDIINAAAARKLLGIPAVSSAPAEGVPPAGEGSSVASESVAAPAPIPGTGVYATSKRKRIY